MPQSDVQKLQMLVSWVSTSRYSMVRVVINTFLQWNVFMWIHNILFWSLYFFALAASKQIQIVIISRFSLIYTCTEDSVQRSFFVQILFQHTDVMDDVIAVISSVLFSASPSWFYFYFFSFFSFYISVKINSAALEAL